MTNEELLQTQNELFRVLVRLLIDERLDSTKEKAEFLAQFDFTHDEIGLILNRSRNTISTHLGSDD